MVSEKIMVKNPTGQHLRPAGLLCNKAMTYQCSVKFLHNNAVSNAKSVLSVLAACVKCGDEIELMCEGEDEEKALKEMIDLIKSGLGE